MGSETAAEEEEEGYPAAKGEGWGDTGVARKGTAPGRSGEENTGGPGGVLRCAGPGPEPGVGEPRAAAAGEKTAGWGGVKGAAGNGGDACAGCGCGRGPGGVSSMAAVLTEIGGAARRSEGARRGEELNSIWMDRQKAQGLAGWQDRGPK